jgi:N utilization substance protein B
MAALQSLFAADIKDNLEESCLDWLTEEDSLSDETVILAERLFQGVAGNRPSLDEITHRYAPAWPVDQLALVDRNILRIALFELLHNTDTPEKTAINEAVELAKAFGSESSARFVNGVLGSVMSGLEMGELAPRSPAPEGE